MYYFNRFCCIICNFVYSLFIILASVDVYRRLSWTQLLQVVRHNEDLLIDCLSWCSLDHLIYIYVPYIYILEVMIFDDKWQFLVPKNESVALKVLYHHGSVIYLFVSSGTVWKGKKKQSVKVINLLCGPSQAAGTCAGNVTGSAIPLLLYLSISFSLTHTRSLSFSLALSGALAGCGERGLIS